MLLISFAENMFCDDLMHVHRDRMEKFLTDLLSTSQERLRSMELLN